MEYLWNSYGTTPEQHRRISRAPRQRQGIPSRGSNQQGQQEYDRHAPPV
jgi:hypothetical protein